MPAGFFISEIPGVVFIIAHKLLLLLVVVRYLGSLTKKKFPSLFKHVTSTDEYSKSTDMLNLKLHISDLLVKNTGEYGAV